ncbi:MAG: hypothetical protein LBS75_03485 [Synergistaceae bacterium]|jgi:hypothetical protein|nr:hypothetical protein [Synergistaceae bacterium]
MFEVVKGVKVSLGGKIYEPGDEITPPEADAERLLRIGAISEIPEDDGGNGEDAGGYDPGGAEAVRDDGQGVTGDDVEVSAAGGDIPGAETGEGAGDAAEPQKSQRRRQK